MDEVQSNCGCCNYGGSDTVVIEDTTADIPTYRRKTLAALVYVVEVNNPPGEPFFMLEGRALDDGYIGSDELMLLLNKGIIPEKRTITSKTASIGRSLSDGLWYGWSHRAIAGFVRKEDAMEFAELVS